VFIGGPKAHVTLGMTGWGGLQSSGSRRTLTKVKNTETLAILTVVSVAYGQPAHRNDPCFSSLRRAAQSLPPRPSDEE
jgi:hypothetical protein